MPITPETFEGYKQSISTKVFDHAIMQDAIKRLVENMAISDGNDKHAEAVVPSEVQQIFAQMTELMINFILENKPIEIDIAQPSFKVDLANQVSRLVTDDYDHVDSPLANFIWDKAMPLFEELYPERYRIMSNNLENKLLSFYSCAGQIAAMLIKNINPEVLRLSQEEARAEMLKRVSQLVESGHKVERVDPNQAVDIPGIIDPSGNKKDFN